MNTLSKASPLKKIKKEDEDDQPNKERVVAERGVEGWPCPSVTCPHGLLKVVRKKNGGEFVTCDHNEWKDPSSCKVSLSLLKASKDHPHCCSLCLTDVGGKPSLGAPTTEKDARGYIVWENIHGVWRHCAGAKTSDSTFFKHATAAGPEHIGYPTPDASPPFFKARPPPPRSTRHLAPADHSSRRDHDQPPSPGCCGIPSAADLRPS